jgi:hypothetical protein
MIRAVDESDGIEMIHAVHECSNAALPIIGVPVATPLHHGAAMPAVDAPSDVLAEVE